MAGNDSDDKLIENVMKTKTTVTVLNSISPNRPVLGNKTEGANLSLELQQTNLSVNYKRQCSGMKMESYAQN